MIVPVSCGTKQGNEETAEGKLEYKPQVSEVETITLERKDFTRQLTANGKLSARARSSMNFRGSGTITDIIPDNGQRVRKGSVIARQDGTEQAIALEAARIALDRAELDYLDVLAGLGHSTSDTASIPEDVKKMARMRSGYDAAKNSLEKAKLDYEGTVLRAPFDGKVADIKLKEHDMSGSDPFCVLIDDCVFEVDFSVLESEYPFLEKGLKVKVTPFAASGKTLVGEVLSINPVVDKNGQVSVKASVRNDGSLIDGMNVKVLVERTVPGMLVVPKSAVVIRDNLNVLFRHSEGRSQWTYVNVLMTNSSDCAVEANLDRGAELAEGDEIIISGNLNLADGSEVLVKE